MTYGWGKVKPRYGELREELKSLVWDMLEVWYVLPNQLAFGNRSLNLSEKVTHSHMSPFSHSCRHFLSCSYGRTWCCCWGSRERNKTRFPHEGPPSLIGDRDMLVKTTALESDKYVGTRDTGAIHRDVRLIARGRWADKIL